MGDSGKLLWCRIPTSYFVQLSLFYHIFHNVSVFDRVCANNTSVLAKFHERLKQGFTLLLQTWHSNLFSLVLPGLQFFIQLVYKPRLGTWILLFRQLKVKTVEKNSSLLQKWFFHIFMSKIKFKIRVSILVRVMRVGSDTFGDPFFQKGLQN